MDSPTNKTKLESPATSDSSLYLTLHRALPEPPPHPPVVVGGYRECRKNHAARLGRLALDGCGEFMPSASASPVTMYSAAKVVPESLVCAACGCHRNFHRRDYWASPGPAQSPSSPRALSPVPTSYYAPAPWMLRAPVTGLLGQAVSLSDCNIDDEYHDRRSSGMKARRKRGRTKFSKEQKEKMEAFAEKVGWRMKSSGDDEKKKAVEEFCKEVGVSRGVLKVWMNNHKHKKATSC